MVPFRSPYQARPKVVQMVAIFGISFLLYLLSSVAFDRDSRVKAAFLFDDIVVCPSRAASCRSALAIIFWIWALLWSVAMCAAAVL